MVTVSWRNVPNPSKDDWIGLWALWNSTEIDPIKHAPVKYQVGHDRSTGSKLPGLGGGVLALIVLREGLIVMDSTKKYK
jgi:hypothetical protein